MRAYTQSETESLPHSEQVEVAVEVFGMLADPTRIRLLWVLLSGEMPVNELAQAVEKPQAAVSQHLAKLRLARLVTTRRQGNQVFYRLTNDHVRRLVEDGIYNAEHVGPGVPQHHQSASRTPTKTEGIGR